MEQPNFDELATSLITASREVGRLPNMPVINQGAQILAQIQQISNSLTQVNATLTQVQQEVAQVKQEVAQVRTEVRTDFAQVQTDMRAGFARLTTRMDASDRNMLARLTNAAITNTDTRISPIFDSHNQAVANFPESLRALSSANGARCTELLTAYGLDSQGTPAEKKKRLRKFFGVVIDLGRD